MSAVLHVQSAAASAAGALAGAAAGVVRTTTEPQHLVMSAALLGLSGACAISGALFFRAEDNEHPVRDSIITVVFPFLLGVAVGPFVGRWLFGLVPGAEEAYQTPLAEHMLGGLIAGVGVVPALRAGIRRLNQIGGGE